MIQRMAVVQLLAGWLTACAGGPPTPQAAPQLWASHEHPLPVDARPFAFAAEAPMLYQTSLGSFTEPLDVRGIVIDTAPRGAAIPARARRFLGRHQLVLGSGVDRIVVRYDTPTDPAPLRPGQPVHLFAHTMAVGAELAFSLSLESARGDLAMAGVRAVEPGAVLLPPGWSVDFGPVLDRERICDGYLYEHAARVRGPGGEAVVSCGWTAAAPLGRNRHAYAVDVPMARTTDATCPEARERIGLSVVLRRLSEGRSPAALEPGPPGGLNAAP